jgi:protein-S-isoprenylcysteine O-methyltransferase Ste14
MLKSRLLVIIQFTGIILFAISGPLTASSFWLQMMELIGVILAAWAILVMNPLRVSVFPEPRPDGELIERGPYAYIRHPMYSSILIIAAALTIDRLDAASIILFLVLATNQVVKLRFEESLL